MSARRLALAVVLAPVAWLAYIQIAYALVPLACRHPGALTHAGLYGVAALLVVGVVAAVVLAWPAWRATDRADFDGAPPEGRTRFLALTGVGSGVFFLLVAIAGIVPLFLLAPCE
jgi:hypothetical protein